MPTEEKIAHTPTPWKITEHGTKDGRFNWLTIDTLGAEIAHVAEYGDQSEPNLSLYTPEQMLANAAHIVRCVNEREQLVKALAAAETHLATYTPFDDQPQSAWDDWDATLQAIKAALRNA
jgi:hypothetical protein